MPGIALTAHFAGDADDLLKRFETAALRYAALPDAPQPTTALLLRNKTGLTVVLAWPDGASLQPFRTFLRGALSELGLPHPDVEHFRSQQIMWE